MILIAFLMHQTMIWTSVEHLSSLSPNPKRVEFVCNRIELRESPKDVPSHVHRKLTFSLYHSLKKHKSPSFLREGGRVKRMQCGYSSHILISTYRVGKRAYGLVRIPMISNIPPHIFSTKREHIVVQAPHLVSVEPCVCLSLYNRGCASP